MYSKTKDPSITFVPPTKTCGFNHCSSGCDKNGAVTETPSGYIGASNIFQKTIVHGICNTEGHCKLKECHGKLCCQSKWVSMEMEPSFGPGRLPSHHEDDCAKTSRKCKPSRGRWNSFCVGEFCHIHTLSRFECVCAYDHIWMAFSAIS